MKQQLRANRVSINYEFDYILRSRNLETDVVTCIDYLVYKICIQRSICRLFTASVVFDFRLNQLRNQKNGENGRWCIFRPTLPTPNPLYYTSDLQARGLTAPMCTYGRSARPPSRSARPRKWLELI